MKRLTLIVLLQFGLACLAVGVTKAQDQYNTVEVPVQQWTNSGISVNSGDVVAIWGFGMARFNSQVGRNLSYFGPGGMFAFNPAHPVGDAPTYCLIGKIGPSGSPFGIGTYWEFVAQSSGELYFGANDLYMDDNVGFFTAIVTVNGAFAPVLINGSDNPSLPNHHELNQNYPNPFNPSTTISYSLQAPAHAVISIYDATGRLVRRFDEGDKTAGSYVLAWDGKSNAGAALASGTYYYQLKAGDQDFAKQMILLK